ncbi:anthranilate 1,2-dioxygenase electron transfer component AntC [Pseudomonas palleroniana]|uniref:anthranilate 1,2-dioxygenase electron transfer component AntC n=1 Tax=Pseudomonas palleroniana TaxID=191390 RepID=UPI0018E66D04|nr:anthranilate 1,2-dioxygenase electron transfer component AntC [Pseudomonas palleroniana]MBI6909608.1 anthranilate 1,2-dioxygenase electron transfer component AntC [Pseudomonas palleroniana]
MNHKVAFSFADGKTSFFEVKPNELLLDAALRHGVNIPLDCREGVCGTCQGRCESGQYTQDYVDDEALSEHYLAQRKMLSCQTRVQSDASFYFDFDSSLCNGGATQLIQAVISRVEQVSANTAILHLDASAHPRQLDFLPGQYARLQVPGTREWRSYSFANRPNPTNQLQFLIRLLPDGVMSNFIREDCQAGRLIEFEAPLGSFYLRQVTQPLVLVAGGTGLSAFLGMLDNLAEKGGSGYPIQLFYGVTQDDDLCEIQRLAGYRERIAGFDYHLIVSKPSEQWKGKTGWIPDHFDRNAFEATPFDIYLCGPPPMVEAVKTWFIEQRVEKFQMFYEKFIESNSKH